MEGQRTRLRARAPRDGALERLTVLTPAVHGSPNDDREARLVWFELSLQVSDGGLAQLRLLQTNEAMGRWDEVGREQNWDI